MGRSQRRVHERFIWVAVCLAPVLLIGCATQSGHRGGPYDTAPQAVRDPMTAQQLTLQAADLIATDPDQAEQLLRQALAADLFHGPAHNNLGVLYLEQDNLYEAACEFEWACKLLPGHPDPRLNLGLTLEQAGRTEDALAQYDTALDAYPGHIQTVEAVARLMVISRKTDERLPDLLTEITLRGETEQWRRWAKMQLALDYSKANDTEH